MKLKSELSSTLELSSKTLRLSDTVSALSWEVAIRLGDDDERVQHGLDPTAFRFTAQVVAPPSAPSEQPSAPHE